MVKNLPANSGDARDAGSIPESGRSPGGGHGNPLLYSCLNNPMDRGAWCAKMGSRSESFTSPSMPQPTSVHHKELWRLREKPLLTHTHSTTPGQPQSPMTWHTPSVLVNEQLYWGTAQRSSVRSPTEGFPCGPVVENPSSNAGDVGWIPGRGTKIPHAMVQLSLRATTREKPSL